MQLLERHTFAAPALSVAEGNLAACNSCNARATWGKVVDILRREVNK